MDGSGCESMYRDIVDAIILVPQSVALTVSVIQLCCKPAQHVSVT